MPGAAARLLSLRKPAGALEVLLFGLWRIWGFDNSYAGFEVAAGATIPVALLLIVASINYLAEEFKWDYLWVIPNFDRVRKPDIFVGIGFVVGFIAGLFLWT